MRKGGILANTLTDYHIEYLVKIKNIGGVRSQEEELEERPIPDFFNLKSKIANR